MKSDILKITFNFLAAFAISRLILTAIGYLGRSIYYSPFQFPFDPEWLSVWGVFDTKWYLEIAQNFFNPNLASEAAAGFFPLYPLLIWIFSHLTNPFISALIISNISTIVGYALLYLHVKDVYGKSLAKETTIHSFIFPTAFLLSASLSEGLTLALAASSFFFAYRQRWLLSSVSAMLLTTCRPYGILIIIPIALTMLKKKDTRNNLHKLVLAPLGLLLVIAYMTHVGGDPLAYLSSKTHNQYHSITDPLTLLLSSGFKNEIFTLHSSST
jgi:hypothetical protein